MSSAADYWVGPTIGEGAFGHVVYAVHKATERKVAIKVVEVSTRAPSGRKRHEAQQKTLMVLNERRVLTLPELKSSEWIVDLLAAFIDDSGGGNRCLYFVMELATGGDLRGLIRRSGLATTPDADESSSTWRRCSVPYYASQLIAAVGFLHSRGILHCDLKPENLLLDAATGNLKLADFGSALDTNHRKDDGRWQHRVLLPRGTANYSAPELLRSTEPSPASALTAAADYWSVGCILHAMLNYGRSPFDRGSEALTVRAVFDHVAARGGLKSTASGCASSDGGQAIEATIEEEEDSTTTNTRQQNKAKTEKGNKEAKDPLQLFSRDLLAAVIPEDRISVWKDGISAFLPSTYNHRGDESDDDHDLPRERGSDQCDSALTNKNKNNTNTSNNQNILLPIPEWQDKVENNELRDGSLGWFVFHI